MNSQSQDRRYVPVRVDGLLYCFDNRVIRSVSLSDACELFDDELPGGIVGEVEYEGDDIPVLRLRSLLNVNTTKRPDREHLAIVATDQGHCAFLVDDVFRAREFQAEDLQPLPMPARNEKYPFFAGIARLSKESFNEEIVLSRTEEGEVSENSEQPGTLLLSHNGLLGVASTEDTSRFTNPAVDVGALLADGGQRTGQLMLFDVPHQTLDDKIVSLGFSVTEVIEVAQARELLPVPCSSENLYGVLPWRNQFVPIVDLTRQLDLGKIPNESRERIVVLRSSDDQLVGFYSSTDIRTVRMPIDAEPYELNGVSNLPVVAGCFVTSDGGLLLLPKSKRLASDSLPQTAA